MNQIEVILGLLVVVVALALLAPRLPLPLPVLLVIGGLLLGIVSQRTGIGPTVHPPPGLLFFVFLPPLLVSAAFNVPLGAFRANLRPITLLAVGLVLATMAAVAETVHTLVGVPRAAAYVLGAIVAPPDPVAASTVARRLGLPTRIATILEGEGLVNDATALVAYQLAVAAVLSGSFSWPHALIEFARSAPTGIVVGLAVGWITNQVLARLDDPVIEPVISLMVPYAAFLGADRIGGSGVLSAVTLGFVLRQRNLVVHEAATRISSRRVWDTLVFLVNGVVFILIGIQLGDVGPRLLTFHLVRVAALVSAVAIVVRLAWMFAVPWLVSLFTRPRYHPGSSPRELLVLGWSGMRGVVSLAAALSIPYVTHAGTPFPGRGIVVLLTYGVLFSTLVIQGATLGPLIRVLGVSDPEQQARQEREARRSAVRVAITKVDDLARDDAIGGEPADRLRHELRGEVGIGRDVGLDQRYLDARAEALRAQHEDVVRYRADGDLSEEIAERLEDELDVETVRLRDMARKQDTPRNTEGGE